MHCTDAMGDDNVVVAVGTGSAREERTGRSRWKGWKGKMRKIRSDENGVGG